MTREEQANLEAGNTSVTKTAARNISIFFLCAVFLLPFIQGIYEAGEFASGSSSSVLPSFTGIYSAAGISLEEFVHTDSGIFGKILAANSSLLGSIVEYENMLEENSVFRDAVIPPVQNLFIKIFGLGNEKAVIGKDGWLFYEPDLQYVSTSIDSAMSNVARDSSKANTVFEEKKTGPLEAIIDFNAQLEKLGIELILLPAPVKPMFQPDKLSRRLTKETEYIQNPGYEQLKDRLEEQGIRVFDAAEVLKNADDLPEPYFLKTDTHWTPQAAEYTAEKLGDFIDEHIPLTKKGGIPLDISVKEITTTGDIARMLSLPPESDIVQPETVTIEQILQNGNEPWTASKDAQILFLGDSFANIYSHPGMDWGESAGIVEQLSYQLGVPVDRIIQNDNGAYATRQALQYELSRGRNRLEGKRVLIWEFAMRELVSGDWKKLKLSLNSPEYSDYYSPEPETETVISGIVYETSSRPVPKTTPYKDHIMSIHLVDVEVDGIPDETFSALVYAFSMNEYILTPAAGLRTGQRVRLAVKSWYDVEDRYNSINRSEIDDDELLFADPCWSEEIIE